jgi:hypothetical protein
VKERRGTVARLAGLAEGVAAAARRRQRERTPRVALYDADGQPRLLESGDSSFEAVVAPAEQMLDLSVGRGSAPGMDEGPEGPSSTGGVRLPATEFGPDQRADARGGTRDEG